MPDYPPAVAELLATDHPIALGPGAPNPALRAKIEAACALVPPACAAGLWLRFDFLDASHAISQEDESSPDRNFWHAIVHRREPDAWNSKYWWRRVGDHPVFDRLAKDARELGYWGDGTRWDPITFVDHCEAERDSGSARETILQRVQLREFELLFEWCYRRSVGG